LGVTTGRNLGIRRRNLPPLSGLKRSGTSTATSPAPKSSATTCKPSPAIALLVLALVDPYIRIR
jgi:hypothetical protein